jgi:probable F420-dependent oxidoreductase
MKFGVCAPTYGVDIAVDGLVKFSRRVEELGFDSIWTTDHILMPSGSGTPYESILESITTLAYLSNVCSKLRLGISSLVFGLRNPVVATKQLATIDFLSKGRVILATGAGWNEAEFSNLGSDYHTRGRRLDEAINLLRKLWESSGRPVDFQSERLNIRTRNGIFSPPPVQATLKVWVSGSSSAAMKRAAELGDAWHPNVQPLDIFREQILAFRRMSGGREKPVCARVAIDPSQTSTEYRSPQGERRFVLSADMGQNESAIQELASMGVSYLVLAPNPSGRNRVDEQISIIETFSRRFVQTGGEQKTGV